MKRAGWLRKAFLVILVVVVVFAAAALGAAHYYLSSGRAAELVAEQLQDLLGGRVDVKGTHIGLIGDSSVQGISVCDSNDLLNPWIRIDDVRADASALSLLLDRSPSEIQLQGTRIALRFDADGHLLTQLPKTKKKTSAKIPRLHIRNGELTIDQEHRSPMIVRGVNADIDSDENGLKLSGTIDDPFWGQWKAEGDFDSKRGGGSITLDAADIDVTMKKLKFIAFVPLSVWDEVEIEGRTPARVRLDLALNGKPTVDYRVEVAPSDARVVVPSIGLSATGAHGKAIIADEIVQLDDVHGKTAGGEIVTSGKLDFRDTPSRLKFKVRVNDVVLRDLPRSWKIPPKIDGRMTGQAHLLVTAKGGKAKIEGTGEGDINQATLAGLQLGAIHMALRSENGRLRFTHSRQVAVKRGEVVEAPSKPKEVIAPQVDPEAKEPMLQEPMAQEPMLAEGGNQNIAQDEEDDKEEGVPGLIGKASTEVVRALGRGVQLAANGLTRGFDTVADAFNKLKPPSKPGEEPTYLDVDLNLKDVDLAQLMARLKLNLPYPIGGRLTIKVHASIPINTPGDMKAYRLRGAAKLSSLSIDGLEMNDVEARVSYVNGVLDLQQLRGRMANSAPSPPTPLPRSGGEGRKRLPSPPKRGRGVGGEGAGKFDGNARVQVVPQGELRAALHLEGIPLGAILTLFPQTKDRIAGSVSGTLQGRAPMAKLSDPQTWRGSATLTAPNIEMYGLTLRNSSVNVKAEQGKVTLTAFKANVAGMPLVGKGELQLNGAFPFQAEIHVDRADLTALDQLAPSLRPPVRIQGRAQLDGTASGTLQPLTFDTKGKASASNLVAKGVKVDAVSFRWATAKDGLKLNAIQAKLYGGDVSGSAVVPLTTTESATAKLRLRDLDVQALAKSLPSSPVRLEGKVSGSVNGKLAPAKVGQPRAWTTDVELTAPKLRVQGVPTEKLKGSLESRDGKTFYTLEGESLGGTFTLKGDLTPKTKKQEQEKPSEPVGRGRLEVRDASLARLFEAFGVGGGLTQLHGRFSFDLPYRHEGANFFPVGNGTFRIVNVRFGDALLSNNLRGDIRLTAQALRLDDLNGDVAGGQFSGRFSFGLKRASRGWFRIDLQQVEASQLLAPLPVVATRVKGPVDVRLRGRIGAEWDGGGNITLVRGQIYGMDIAEWRLPLTFRFSPAQGNGEATTRDSVLQVARGRGRFDAALHWGNGLGLKGTLHFQQVDLRTLLRRSPSVSSYASGRVSGRVDLSGSEMRSINDLRALVQAKLRQTQALQLPVLRQIIPYLRIGTSSATFNSGQLKGRLAGGIFTVQHLALVGNLLQLIVEGTVTLAGRLNLEVTAQTGLFCLNPRQRDDISSRIPIVGAIPRLLLFEASALLANQVVHLRVTGTLRSPTVRIQPLLTLTEDAMRFFFGRLLAPAIRTTP